MNYRSWPTKLQRIYYAILMACGALVLTQLNILEELLRREREADEEAEMRERYGVNCVGGVA